MNEFKFQLLSIVLIILLGLGVYWAFSHLYLGVPHQDIQVLDTDLPAEEETPLLPEETSLDPEPEPEETPSEVDTKELSAEEQEIYDALGRLIDDKIYMKKGSRGTRVGTVQKFLNYYFKTDKVVDNDYGPGTIADVKKFQEALGLGADGLAGPQTYTKMMESMKS